MATWSGIGRYSRSLARALSERGDVELSLIAMQDIELPEQLAELQIITAQKHPLSSGGFREMRDAVIVTEPDIVHCTHITTPNLKNAFRKMSAPPIITTLHDLTPLLVQGVMPSLAKRAVYSGLNQRSIAWSKAIITPSEHTKDDIEKFFPKAISEGQITAIPLAADEFLELEPARPITMECLQPQFQKNFLLSMGNTKPHKNLPTLLKTFEQLAERHPELSLILVGREPVGYVKEHVASELQDRVQFFAGVSDENLAWLYQHERAFIFPSLYEGFGLPPLEAMTFACPVIAADAASIPEVVGDAGAVVAANDIDAFVMATERVLSDEDYATELEDRVLERAGQFSWAKTAEQTTTVYQSLLQ